jgi:hypothetical protein
MRWFSAASPPKVTDLRGQVVPAMGIEAANILTCAKYPTRNAERNVDSLARLLRGTYSLPAFDTLSWQQTKAQVGASQLETDSGQVSDNIAPDRSDNLPIACEASNKKSSKHALWRDE